MKTFAITGVAGFVAPRHLQAIQATGNTLAAALDPHDAVGILDKYFPDTYFFTETERFERHLEKMRRLPHNKGIDYLSICSPNYLHDAHIRMGLRLHADVICEKPLVLNPWNLDLLQEIEKESGNRIYTVLQLRLHPQIRTLYKKVSGQTSIKRSKVKLVYVAPRGNWYAFSWKGDVQKSGGIATNIGIHFFDVLLWIFGPLQRSELIYCDTQTMMGEMELERADVTWCLSIDKKLLPDDKTSSFRKIIVDDNPIEFSDGFADLHTEVYKDILQGGGFGILDARPSIETTYLIRNSVKKHATWDISQLKSIFQ